MARFNPTHIELVRELESLRERLRQQDEKLRESQRQLEGVLEAVEQSVMLMDPDGTIVECNETFAARLGRAREELAGTDVYQYLPPDIAQQRKRRVDEAARLRAPVSFVDQRGGRQMAHRIVPIVDERNNVARFAVHGADITAHTRVSDELERTNELLRAIRHVQSLYIAGTEPKAIFTGLLQILVNVTQSEYGFLDEVLQGEDGIPFKRSLAITDISWDDASRELHRQLVAADYLFLNLNNLAGAAVTSGRFVIANRPDLDARSGGLPPGHPPINSFLGLPLHHGGELVGVAGVANRPGGYHEELVEFLAPLSTVCAGLIAAVRVRKREEEARQKLRRSEEYFKLLYEQAPSGYQSLDIDGRLLEVNQAWLELLGYARDEVIGRSFADFLVPAQRPLFAERFSRFKEIGEVHGVEFAMIRKDGNAIDVGFDGRIARDEGGRFLRTHCIMHDIRARKQSESLLVVERDLASALSAAGGLEEVVSETLKAALNATGLDGGGVYLVDAATGEVRLACHAGLSREFAEAVACFGPDSEEARLLARGETVELPSGTFLPDGFLKARCDGIKSVAVIPVIHGERTIGSLNLGSRSGRRIAPHARQALETIAAQMSVAVARMRSEAAQRRIQAELRAVYDSSPVMMCVLDGNRCVRYVNRALAEYVGKTEDELRNERACGIIGCANALDDPRGCGFGSHCEDCSLRLALFDTLQTGRSHRGVERRMTLARPDGRQEVVLQGATARIETAGEMRLLLCLEDITERKRAEEQLQFQAMVLDQIADAVVVTDLEGRITYVNNAECRSMKWPREGLVGQSVESFGDDPRRGATQREIIAATQRDGHWRGEVVNRATDGSEILLDCRTQMVTDSTGRPVAMCGISSDITGRKQMEAALEASEARLQAIFRAAPTGIGVVVDRVFQEVNQRVLDMTGYRREELIGQDSRLLYPTEADYDYVGREKYRQIAERGAGTVETLWRRKDGTVINVLLSSTPLDPADHSKGLTFSALEFTDRVRMERSLRESEALLARAEEIGGIGSFIWDFASGRLTWSKGLHALCGLAPGQADDTLDGGIWQAVHPEDQERIRKELNRMVAARRVWPVEFRIVRPDGDERLVQSAGEFVMSDNGFPVRLVGILLDITARRAGENRLEAMQWQLNHASRLATLGELVAGIAHEVNQPLCAIVNFSKAARNLASRAPADLEQIRAWADAAASAAAQAGDIVRRLLDFSRRGQPDYETVEVRRLVDDALLLVQYEARLKQIAVRIEVPEGLSVLVRSVPIQQVIVNLLRNSIDSLGGVASRARQVAVRALKLEACVEISVTDNGRGVPEADRARLFEPFFTTKPHGVGLGLAISKRIVEEHKGEIWATANPGGGLAVHFTLPASGD